MLTDCCEAWADIQTFSISVYALWIFKYTDSTDTWSTDSLVGHINPLRPATINLSKYSIVVLPFPRLALAAILNVFATQRDMSMMSRWSWCAELECNWCDKRIGFFTFVFVALKCSLDAHILIVGTILKHIVWYKLKSLAVDCTTATMTVCPTCE